MGLRVKSFACTATHTLSADSQINAPASADDDPSAPACISWWSSASADHVSLCARDKWLDAVIWRKPDEYFQFYQKLQWHTRWLIFYMNNYVALVKSSKIWHWQWKEIGRNHIWKYGGEANMKSTDRISFMSNRIVASSHTSRLHSRFGAAEKMIERYSWT